MGTNLDLHKKLRAPRARFYLADFHVHSPASADVRLAPHYGQLSKSARSILDSVPESLASNPIEYESAVISAFPPSAFLKELISRRDSVLAGLDSDSTEDWAIVAMTDHNICKYSCGTASLAWTQLSENRIIVLPGMELSVTYPVPPGNEKATAHLLCIFAPNTSDSDIRIAITSANNNADWTFGDGVTLQSLESFVKGLRNHPNYPAICIAAHVGSGAGVQNVTRKVMLSRLDAAISRVKGELEVGDEPDTEELNKRLLQLENERQGADEISLQTLNLIGLCGFDALQVRGQYDEVHYRRLHRFNDKFGRAVPIVCSDAHTSSNIFMSESGLSHIKLSDLSAGIDSGQLFAAIRHALRLGETRFSYVPPSSPQYWIAGIEIIPDAQNAASFWPFESHAQVGQTKSFILPLSRNLNCLIGGRGSGKSAALEAIAFLARPSNFDGFVKTHEEDLPDYYTRARANLSGCKSTLCWQFVGHELAQHLPKHTAFASRYFDPAARHEAITYSNADNVELLQTQIPDHVVQYYRLGEIEQQAGAEKLRGLFDQICGSQIQEHERNIQEQLLKLSDQRNAMVKVSQKVSNLTKDGGALREYAQRKRLFDEVDLAEVRDAYEEVDRASAANSLVDKAIPDWSNFHGKLDLSTVNQESINFFDDIETSCKDDQGQIKPYHEKLSELSASEAFEGQGDHLTTRQTISNVVNALDTELGNVSEILSQTKDAISSQAKVARDALSARGLPPGSKEREAKKNAFDEAVEALKQYRQFVLEWDDMNNERKGLVVQLSEECQRRSSVRQNTATDITNQLKRDLDSSFLVIEADAQPQMDMREFLDWMKNNFTLSSFRYRESRFAALISDGLKPDSLRNLLLQEENTDHTILKVKRLSAENGDIDESIAKKVFDHCVGRYRLECEIEESSVHPTFWADLPEEIRDGLITFPSQEKAAELLKIDDVLKLDEITFDDIPVIRLNDRPHDPHSKPRPVESLSPGQRCSAILPILLLTGSSPLIIDQPEDNMDNRLIRQVIVNILSSIKLRRQVIIATHNPNLPVLGDVEQTIILQGVGESECQVLAIGDLDSGDVVHHLTEVMEGGREAFQYRQTIYQIHWPGPVYTASNE